MYINDTNSNSYDVHCNSSDTCKIDCLSTDGCTNMNLYCYCICKLASSSRAETFEYNNSTNNNMNNNGNIVENKIKMTKWAESRTFGRQFGAINVET